MKRQRSIKSGELRCMRCWGDLNEMSVRATAAFSPALVPLQSWQPP